MSAAEDQGRRYASLDVALRARDVPSGNRRFVHALVDHIDFAAFYTRDGYIKGVRSAGGPAIEIHPSCTSGFTSEQEIIAAVGDVERAKDPRRRGLWRVEHPVIAPNFHDTVRHRPTPRVCPVHGVELSVSGRCDYCD